MMILHAFAGFQPLRLERLLSTPRASGDFRRAIVTLALHWFAAFEAFAQTQLDALAGAVMRRAWQGACFAADLTDADSMVAAGGR